MAAGRRVTAAPGHPALGHRSAASGGNDAAGGRLRPTPSAASRVGSATRVPAQADAAPPAARPQLDGTPSSARRPPRRRHDARRRHASGARQRATTPSQPTPTGRPASSRSRRPRPRYEQAHARAADRVALRPMQNFDCACQAAGRRQDPDPAGVRQRRPRTHHDRYLLGPVIVPGTEISRPARRRPTPQGQTAVDRLAQPEVHRAEERGRSTPPRTTPASTDITTRRSTTCDTTTTPVRGLRRLHPGRRRRDPRRTTSRRSTAAPPRSAAASTRSAATELANQLKYGALPLSFNPRATDRSPRRWAPAQLKAGLLAGGIGLILVVIYSLIYYRALGLVTIASLLVSGALTYALPGHPRQPDRLHPDAWPASPASSSRSVSPPTRSSCSSNE